MLLYAIAFLAGIVTAISPCVYPVLPIIFAGGASGGRRRPYAIIAGLVVTFVLSLLFVGWVLDQLGLPQDFLRKALTIRSNRLAAYSFDPHGNFSFGVPDYTDFEGMKYDPEIGVFGMDIAVALERPGFRITRRKIAARPIPRSHRISKGEGIEFIRSTYKVEVVE